MGSGGPAAGMTEGYSDREAMMADLESDLVERKESLRGDSRARIPEAVCAFANDLPDYRRPGVVLVGADDAGKPTGLEITDQLLLQLADIKTDGNIVPPPTLTVAKRVLGSRAVAVVIVRPSDSPPVRYRGRTWIRVGAAARDCECAGRADPEREAPVPRSALRFLCGPGRHRGRPAGGALHGRVPAGGGRCRNPGRERPPLRRNASPPPR